MLGSWYPSFKINFALSLGIHLGKGIATKSCVSHDFIRYNYQNEQHKYDASCMSLPLKKNVLCLHRFTFLQAI